MIKTVEIQVRFSDLDPYGHVNNSVYFSYMEVARTKSFKHEFDKFFSKKMHYVILNTECSYKLPIKEGDDVFVDVWVSEIKKLRITFSYKIRNSKGDVFATSSTQMCILDGETEKPAKIPEGILRNI